MIFKPFSLNIRGSLVEFDRPAVMGIVNVTPDSFYAASRTMDTESLQAKVADMIAEGADIIDLGGYSSRPGAAEVDPEEELHRIAAGMKAIREIAPDIPVSIDTFRSRVARTAVEEYGADIINDISGGMADPDMDRTVADMHVPFIVMHMRGTPADMHLHTDYDDVTARVLEFLSRRTEQLRLLGVNDIILDPGFGFAKTVEQNYELMNHLDLFTRLTGLPVLAGISRKSMLWRPLGITPDESLEATTALNTIALMKGAAILRVHDVKAARQAVDVTCMTLNNPSTLPHA